VAGVFVKVHVRWLILDGENHIDVILGPGVADDSRCDTQASRPWRRHRHLPAQRTAPGRVSAPIQATAITARPASLRRARAARFAANALARPAVEPSPSPPTSTSWRLRVSARPGPSAPPTTGRPGPRQSGNSPTWSAAATATAACVSAAWPKSPPSSAAGRRGQPGPAGRAGPALDPIGRLGCRMTRPRNHPAATPFVDQWLPGSIQPTPGSPTRAAGSMLGRSPVLVPKA
jgi:hypothetical protein